MILSAEEFISLRSSDVKAEYDRAAHEEAPLDVWKDVLERYPDYTLWIIHNKTVPLEILQMLSTSNDAKIRRDVAVKRKLSPELFEQLSQDADPEVRSQIAINKKTPLHILELLCNDKDQSVANTAKSQLKGRTTGIWI
ncbi:MAG: hypothetical protein LBO00_03255 [Zoogloeaceae bacterium]|jgi:hypothetical protein|nr:hypothetical protein [Zoogloeaceae bacterium]